LIDSRSKIRTNFILFLTDSIIFIFHINIPFDEDLFRGENNIKDLFKEVCKDNSHKVIVIAKSKKSVLGIHIHENFETFEQNGIDMNTAVPSILF